MSIRGHHQFSAVAKRHVVLFAELIRKPDDLHAKPRFQRIFRVINAGVVHAAVARAGGHAELWKLLDKKNVLPVFGDGARDRAPNHAAADDQNVGLVNVCRSSKLENRNWKIETQPYM